MMLSQSVFLLGILPSLIPWFLSNPTPLGISLCSGRTSTIWFRIPTSLRPQMPQIMPYSLITSSTPLSTSSCPGNSMRSTLHLLHPHLQSLSLTPELLAQPPLVPVFKRCIKRDISAYPTLKDEKYYEFFKRSVLVTARAHDCEEIIQPTFRPRGDADSLELFRLKNDFMYSVFNKCLLSDMGKTIVRKHLDNMNAQRVWEEFATHMTTSSKGKAEKRRLHTYVTTTVFDKSCTT